MLYLLGHFSDNALPMPGLEKRLELDQNNPDLKYDYLAARKWLTQRRGSEAGIADINDEDQDAWRNTCLTAALRSPIKPSGKLTPLSRSRR